MPSDGHFPSPQEHANGIYLCGCPIIADHMARPGDPIHCHPAAAEAIVKALEAYYSPWMRPIDKEEGHHAQ